MLSPTSRFLPASQYGSSFHQERIGDGYSGRRNGFWIVVSIIIYPTKFHSCNQTERQQLTFNSFNLTMVKLLELCPDCVNSLSPKTIIKRWLTAGLQSMYLNLAGLWKVRLARATIWGEVQRTNRPSRISSFRSSILARSNKYFTHSVLIIYT